MTNFIEELKWRGLFYDMIPGTEEHLLSGKRKGYIGFDPTAVSLGIGNMVQVMILKHFQLAGHQPIAVVGGATGMIGDPSGKSSERNLLSEDALNANLEGQKAQLRKFLDFETSTNPAIMVNNYDWFREMGYIDFLRVVGKHLTLNYMIAKDSVKSRMDSGISYTEFSYQLLQAYDFYWLHKNHNCTLQLGGSDQWGNLTAGVELIRRMSGGEAFAATTPLVTKADGTKFGKTEEGNVWIDPNMTSPYKFYQFWINASDDDAEKYIKIFTLLGREEIEALIAEHADAPHQRKLQKRLAEEVTTFVHSKEDYETAIAATEILFGKGTKETLMNISENQLLQVFEGVPRFNISRDALGGGIGMMDFLAEHTQVMPSKGEARRTIKGNALSINKEKITDEQASVSPSDLLNDRYILVQKGKKNYYLIIVE